MRLLILLIVLGIGAVLVAQQLRERAASVRRESNASARKTLQTPMTPQELPAFKKSVNRMVNQENKKERATIQKESQ